MMPPLSAPVAEITKKFLVAIRTDVRTVYLCCSGLLFRLHVETLLMEPAVYLTPHATEWRNTQRQTSCETSTNRANESSLLALLIAIFLIAICNPCKIMFTL